MTRKGIDVDRIERVSVDSQNAHARQLPHTATHNHPAVSRPPSVAEETSPLNSTYCRLTVLVVK